MTKDALEVQTNHDPFAVLMNPTGVLDIVRKSSSIGMLQRRVFAKADAARVTCANLGAYDAQIDAEFARKAAAAGTTRVVRR